MSKPPLLPRFGLAIDWETSGYSLPDYAKMHQGLAFGAVVFDVKTLEIADTMYREIMFDSSKYLWEDSAEKIHGLTREHLKTGCTQQQAATDLGNLIVSYTGLDKLVLLGHRVYFDESFTNQLMDTIDVQLTYDPIRIDSAAIGLIFTNTTSSDQLFERCGLPPREKHNALEDIMYTLESIKRIKAGLR